MLSDDIARCAGIRTEDGWLKGCEDCLRRLALIDRTTENVWMITPVAGGTVECDLRRPARQMEAQRSIDVMNESIKTNDYAR